MRSREMSSSILFNRPDIVSTIYSATPVNGLAVSPGDRLDAHLSEDGRHVRLAKGHVCVGQIDSDGAVSLLEALRQSGSPGLVPMTVTSVSPVSGWIKAAVAVKEVAQ